jgi:hypothetical protein
MEKYPEEKHPDEAAITPAVVEFGETLNMATVAADEEHAQSKWEAVKAQPAATMWAVFVFLIICLEGFDYQAGGSVLGIQKFREDYG